MGPDLLAGSPYQCCKTTFVLSILFDQVKTIRRPCPANIETFYKFGEIGEFAWGRGIGLSGRHRVASTGKHRQAPW